MAKIGAASGLPDARPAHVAFTDESNWNTGRFRAVAAVSLPVSEEDELREQLKAILQAESLPELKWERVGRDGRATRAADAVLRSVVDAATRERLRLDVLTWDIQDSRHKVVGRDDSENLARMYHHLLVAVCQRWPPGRSFVHPDQGSPVRWWELQETVQAAYRKKGAATKVFAEWLREAASTDVLIEPRSSTDEVFIQVADLAAGAVCFSRANFSLEALDRAVGQERLFGDQADESKAGLARWQLLASFQSACKARRLGVSLRSSRGLRTYRSEHPINFWWWEPQGAYDKAPTRRGAPRD